MPDGNKEPLGGVSPRKVLYVLLIMAAGLIAVVAWNTLREDTRVADEGPSGVTRESPGPSTGSDPSHTKVAAPDIVWKPIPFGPDRQRQTAAYALRHYGIDDWHLNDPRAVIVHFTGTPTFSPAWRTFASNAPYGGELPAGHPGTCAHFIIDRDGTIYQLVRLDTICRHTIGLNSAALGIEHVGVDDAQILRNRKQMASSMQLTLWLMERYGISLGDVVGHAESTSSPYYTEQVAAWRCAVHADWPHSDMNTYRRRLASYARNGYGIVLDPQLDRQDNGC